MKPTMLLKQPAKENAPVLMLLYIPDSDQPREGTCLKGVE